MRPTPDELLSVDLFRDLSAEERATVASWLEAEAASAGQRITHEDADGYVFFVLKDGDAEVTIHGESVRRLTSGDVFGEISLLHGTRQTATVTVTSPSVVWRMFGTSFRQLQTELPLLAERLERLATEREGNDPATVD